MPFFVLRLNFPISFWLLNLSTLLFFFSFNIIIPEMPDYISSLGGADKKGHIIGLFTIAAALSRPISGKLADSIGRLPVMYFGGIVSILVSFFYPIFGSVLGFLTLRTLHGLSTGFLPTGNVAFLSDIIPKERRGQAMGISGIMNNLGFMGGNALSSLIVEQFGVNGLFYVSGLLALASVAIFIKMKESLEDTQRFKLKMLVVKKDDVYDHRAFQPAMVMFLTTMSFGAILTLIPDYSKGLGIMNKGLYLSVTTVSTILVRIWGGKLSDKIGRLKATMIGTACWILCTLSLVTLDHTMFFVSAVLMGCATGMNAPSLFAWAVDVADGLRAGRVMATLFIAMELGITMGAFGSAWIYGNDFQQLRIVFAALAMINVIAIGFLYAKSKAQLSVNQ